MMTKRRMHIREEIVAWVQAFLFAAAIIGVLLMCGFNIKQVEGPSMNPTLETEDRLLTSNFHYTPKCGDIVVFYNETTGKDFVKRVIATEGQTVDIHFETGVVTVDGEIVLDAFSGDSMALISRGNMYYPAVVPQGCIFVMGDNRGNSTDSRSSSVGMVKIDAIKGKVFFRVFPLQKIGTVQ